ncbi:MAG TPA: NUDIX domain-containing protein [Candidatus Eisenbacteria bacterium]|nr:NUDIX domain-containing protein [Candidatus Eisenbacteria bacterium]
MIQVAAAVVRRGSLVLLTQRPEGGKSPLAWEFPGGKIEPGESPAQALAREIQEELGVGARVGDTLAVVRHEPTGVEIHFLDCILESEDFIRSAAVRDVRWVDPGHGVPEDLLVADREFFASLAFSRESGGS